MKEIRIHARAGQGAITTAAILGQAYFVEGRFVFAFPHFGAARMGAPMNAFVRVDDRKVRVRSQVYEPDYIIVVDPTLFRGFNCFVGLKPQGVAVIDGKDGLELPKAGPGQKVYVLPASKIAQESIGRPLANTVLLGAFASATDEISFASVEKAIRMRFKGSVADKNVEAARRGYDFVNQMRPELMERKRA